MDTTLDDLCQVTDFLDHDAPAVRDFVDRALEGTGPQAVDRAVALYYAVRDGIYYEVYGADLSRTGLRASEIIRKGTGFCIHKSVVYAAALRAAGIPSRLVLADVRNHLASARLKQLVGGDVFRFHCLTSVHLDGQWVRATPVFNKMLCRLYQMSPLDFDGSADSMYHPYDESGRRHMEFLHDHGEFDDFPYDLVVDGIRDSHPLLFESQYETARGSLLLEGGG